mgnify:FL=1
MPYVSNMITLERAIFEIKRAVIEPYLIYDEDGCCDGDEIEEWFKDKPWLDDFELTDWGLTIIVDFNNMEEPMPKTIREIEDLLLRCIPATINKIS